MPRKCCVSSASARCECADGSKLRRAVRDAGDAIRAGEYQIALRILDGVLPIARPEP